MNTLDRYIARQYLFNALALLVILFSFVVAVDVALNLDKFLKSATDMMGPTGGGEVRRIVLATLLVFDLWWPRLLQLFTYLVGLVLVAAMGFTFTQMVRNREMVAVLAGGISLHRLMRPVLIVAAVFLVIKVIDQECVLSQPKVAALLARDTNDAGVREWKDFPVRLASDSDHRVWLARRFDPGAGEMEDVTIWVRDAGGQAQSIIHADKAQWRAGGWDLTGSRHESTTLALSGSSAVVGRDSAPTRILTDLDPSTLKFNRYATFSQTLSWGQIGEMLGSASVKPDVRDRLQRIRWGRVSQLLSSVLSLIITMPFFLMREPRNMLLQSLKASPIGIISLMGGVLLSSVAWPGLPPGFAVFIPVLVLIPVAIAAVSWLKT